MMKKPSLSAIGVQWRRFGKSARLAFSLLEVLVACTVLTAILLVLLSVTNHASSLWKSGNARVEAFQGSRIGFETVTRLLAQSTLNTYWDYDNPNSPLRYIRQSELHFLINDAKAILGNGDYYGQAVFFQAPGNYNAATSGSAISSNTDSLTGLLNACGFFVEFASDRDRGWVPSHVDGEDRKRFRLMQWMERNSALSVYKTSSGATETDWIGTAPRSEAVPVADNVIALIIWPKEPDKQSVKVLPDSYHYDSRENGSVNPQPANVNQLPPVVQVAMVAMDEQSASRLGDSLQATIEGCLNGLFVTTPGVSFESDLKKLEDALIQRNINHRVFISAIPLKEAKWSPEQ